MKFAILIIFALLIGSAGAIRLNQVTPSDYDVLNHTIENITINNATLTNATIVGLETVTDSDQINWTPGIGAKLTNVTNGTAAQDAVTYSQLVASSSGNVPYQVHDYYIYNGSAIVVKNSANATIYSGSSLAAGITAICAATGVGPAKVELGKGNFTIDSMLHFVNKSHIRFVGQGIGVTTLAAKTNLNTHLVVFDGCNNITVEQFSINGKKANQAVNTSCNIIFNYTRNFVAHDIESYNANTKGIGITGSWYGEVYSCTFHDNYQEAVACASLKDVGSTHYRTSYINVHDCTGYRLGTYGFSSVTAAADGTYPENHHINFDHLTVYDVRETPAGGGVGIMIIGFENSVTNCNIYDPLGVIRYGIYCGISNNINRVLHDSRIQGNSISLLTSPLNTTGIYMASGYQNIVSGNRVHHAVQGYTEVDDLGNAGNLVDSNDFTWCTYGVRKVVTGTTQGTNKKD